MSLQQTINYNNLSNFTVTPPNLADTDVVKTYLKELTLANIMSGASFHYNKDLEIYSLGDRTSILNGAAVYEDQEIKLLGDVTAYVTFDAVDNADSQQIFTLRSWIKPAYTGAALPEQDIMLVGKSGSFKNLVRLRMSGTTMRLYVYNENSADMIVGLPSFGTWNAGIAGTIYEMELNVDCDNIARLFIENKTTGICEQIGSGVQLSGIRSSDIDILRFGATPLGNEVSNISLMGFEFFNTIQHTSNYSPSTMPQVGKYSRDNPLVLVNSGVLTDKFEGLVATLSALESDWIKFIFNISGVNWWYNTVTEIWEVSSGSSQSNEYSILHDNRDSLNLLPNKTIKLGAYLHSENGETTPTITVAILDYAFEAVQTPPHVCVVYGTVLGMDKQPVEGAVITFNAADFWVGDNFITIEKRVLTEADGTWEADIVSSVHEVDVTVEYLEGEDDDERKIEMKCIVPVTDEEALADILV